MDTGRLCTEKFVNMDEVIHLKTANVNFYIIWPMIRKKQRICSQQLKISILKNLKAIQHLIIVLRKLNLLKSQCFYGRGKEEANPFSVYYIAMFQLPLFILVFVLKSQLPDFT